MLALIAAQGGHSAVTGRFGVVLQTRLMQVGKVVVRFFLQRDAAPDASDHANSPLRQSGSASIARYLRAESIGETIRAWQCGLVNKPIRETRAKKTRAARAGPGLGSTKAEFRRINVSA